MDGGRLTAEQRARVLIVRQLTDAGWSVQNRSELNLFAGQGVAVREVIMAAGHGRADYLLYVDQRAVGAIEAKPEGRTLSGVEWQSAMYAEGLPPEVRLKALTTDGRLPFVLEASGSETHFTNGFDPSPRARRIFNVPRPETLARILRAADADPEDPTWRAKARHMPPLLTEGLRPAQIDAIRAIERSLAEQRFDRSLVQMATGAGKTFTAVTESYRLLKHAGFRRVLFLVDRNNLGDGVQFFDPAKPKAYLIDGPAWVNNHAHVLRTRSDQVERRFLLYYLNWADYRGFANGTTRLKLTKSAMTRIPIPLPDLSEQRRIVEILEDHLSRLDAAAAQVEAVQQRLETWKRLALDQLVREQASGTIKLGDLVARIEAGRSFGGSAPSAAPDEWGIIKVSAMTWGSFRAEENKAVPADRVDPRHEIQPGDVLVSRANTTEYVGAPVLVTSTRPRLLLSDKSLRIIPRAGTDRSWLATVLGARSTRGQISRLATGTKDSMRNISQSSLLSVEVPVANAQQQREVVARAAMIEDRAEQLDTELSNALIRGQVLRRSLLTAAFSGRLAR